MQHSEILFFFLISDISESLNLLQSSTRWFSWVFFSQSSMDCCIANQYDCLQATETLPNISSPEMFDSDTERKVDNKIVNTLLDSSALAAVSPQKPSQVELVAKSDNNLLTRINKFLRGVPPPPRHTICQNDCFDFLQNIYENRHLFCSGYPLSSENLKAVESTKSQKQIIAEREGRNISQCTRGTPRNLTNAFDTCNSPFINDTQLDASNINNIINGGDSNYIVLMETRNPINMIKETVRVPPILDNSNLPPNERSLLYHTIDEKEAMTLKWPQAYSHKFYGIQ